MNAFSSALRGPTGLLALALTLILAGCGGGPAGLDDFEDARERWEAQEIEDYSFVLRPRCFCGFTADAMVTVEDGEVVTVVNDETGEPLEAHEFALIRTIDELFDILDEALEEDAHEIQAEYDAELGYPREFWIDYAENVADEELGYRVMEFAPIG